MDRRKTGNAVVAAIMLFLFTMAAGSDLMAGDSVRVDLSGSLQLQVRAYATDLEEPRREAFSWRINATPTLSIGPVAIPLDLLVGDYQSPLRQSFNRYGGRVEYEWLTAHLGHSSVGFSPLVADRRYMLGAGLELMPSLARLGFLYGRMRRSVSQAPGSAPSYRRTGYVARAGVGTEHNYMDLVLLDAADDELSAVIDADSGGIAPEENTAIGISTEQRIAQFIFLEAHAGLSLYNRDSRSEQLDTLDFFGSRFMDRFTPLRRSSQLLYAVQSSLEYRRKAYGIGLSYDRISPDYRTMGIFYLQDDVERWTLNGRWRSPGQQVQLTLRAGVEHNNLRRDRFYRQQRMVGALQLRWRISKGWAVHTQLTNLVQQASLEQLAFSDTLLFEQTSIHTGAGFHGTILRPRTSHQLNGSLYYLVNNSAHPEADGQRVHMMTGQFLYGITIAHSGWTIQAGGDLFRTDSNGSSRLRAGPQAGIQKYLGGRRLLLGIRSTLHVEFLDSNRHSLVSRQTLVANLRLFHNNYLRLRAYYLSTGYRIGEDRDYREFQLDAGLRFAF